MAGEIQALYSKYQQKYPLYNKEKIVDIMLNDGVITFDVAKKIKSGKSLFLIDNEFKASSQNDLSMTELMGGCFSTAKKPITNFNKKIEPTKQPMTQGDCWLLSDINALSYTEFGRKAISDAIIPDKNGSGGVTIKFKGSPLKQKAIHITASEIDKARKSGNYSSGDDDMIAFELATEKTFKEMVKQGLAERAEDDEYIKQMGGKYRSFIFAGIKTNKFDQYPISELLGVKAQKIYVAKMREHKTSNKDIEQMLINLSENKNNVSCWCAFSPVQSYGNKKSKNYIHGGHAYAIKTISKGKEVILTDPHYSNYEIKVPWKVFKELVIDITVSYKDQKTEQQFKSNALPKNYEQNLKKIDKEFENNLKNFFKKMGIK